MVRCGMCTPRRRRHVTGSSPGGRCVRDSFLRLGEVHVSRLSVGLGGIDVPADDPAWMDTDDLVTEPPRIHGRVVDREGFRAPPDLHAAAHPRLDRCGLVRCHVVDDEAHSWVGQHVAVSLGRGQLRACDVDRVVGVQADRRGSSAVQVKRKRPGVAHCSAHGTALGPAGPRNGSTPLARRTRSRPIAGPPAGCQRPGRPKFRLGRGTRRPPDTSAVRPGPRIGIEPLAPRVGIPAGLAVGIGAHDVPSGATEFGGSAGFVGWAAGAGYRPRPRAPGVDGARACAPPGRLIGADSPGTRPRRRRQRWPHRRSRTAPLSTSGRGPAVVISDFLGCPLCRCDTACKERRSINQVPIRSPGRRSAMLDILRRVSRETRRRRSTLRNPLDLDNTTGAALAALGASLLQHGQPRSTARSTRDA